MDQRQADLLAGLVVGSAVGFGLLLTWNAYLQQQAVQDMGGMMGGGGMMGSMSTVVGPDPLWYLLGTLIVGGILGGGYLLVRGELVTEPSQEVRTGRDPGIEQTDEFMDRTDEHSERTSERDETTTENVDDTGETRTKPDILEVLPEDERRVLEPVVESPGLTQIALRDRADFSKSKVSQTVSDLEKRGLLYRERQGRTYRVYPAEDLDG